MHLDCDKRIALFSGRFDRPHLGHIIQIGRLAQRYKKVIVVVLNYCNSFYNIGDREKVLRESVGLLKGDVEVVVNTEHFAYITKEDLNRLPDFDVYCSGNTECLAHIKTLGYEIDEIERYPGYAATKDRLYTKFEKFVLEEIIPEIEYEK